MTTAKTKTIPLSLIRGLLVKQNGKCAITGDPLNPVDVNADHIIPLSRKELSPSKDGDNIWLVGKKINAMKGTLTYEELLDFAKRILEHEHKTRELMNVIVNNKITEMDKEAFDLWVSENCDEEGVVKSKNVETF